MLRSTSITNISLVWLCQQYLLDLIGIISLSEKRIGRNLIIIEKATAWNKAIFRLKLTFNIDFVYRPLIGNTSLMFAYPSIHD